MPHFVLLNHPVIIFFLTLVTLWASAVLGAFLKKGRPELKPEVREDLNVVVAASLTLLGLIIGFTFSMAMVRYDQRKDYEEAEANAIGTEYMRADLLPAPDGDKVRALLKRYTEKRIAFYSPRNFDELEQINATTAKLQAEMWTAVRGPALDKPSPVMALAVSGMNDVLNSQGYTQSAWWNRIPSAAWSLMAAIAIFCNLLIGYCAHPGRALGGRFLLFAFIVAVAFLLISDIESPRRGLIIVKPMNLISLAESLK